MLQFTAQNLDQSDKVTKDEFINVWQKTFLSQAGVWRPIFQAMFRVRKFLGLPDTAPLVRGTVPDPNSDPSSINQINVEKNYFLLAS